MTEKATFGALFNRSVNIFNENWKLLLVFSLIISAVMFVGELTAIFFTHLVFGLLSMSLLGTILYITVLLILIVAIALLTLLFSIRIFFIVEGVDKNMQECWQLLKSRLVPLILTGLMTGLFLMGLYILLIIPGIVFTIYWWFTTQSVLFRDKKYTEALGYSKSLVDNNWWRVFGYLILLTLIVGILGMVFTSALSPFRPEVSLEGVEGLKAGMAVSDMLLNSFLSFIENIWTYLLTYASSIFVYSLFLQLEKEKGTRSLAAPETE